ncbi:MAG: TIGR00725 family protein [Dissulfurimicrobium sp.]|uniref:TIGR00725 family protein n=1 Tax=Dissulfurimicrobium sp. TaxID=2022436 RepID=UPI00404928DA
MMRRIGVIGAGLCDSEIAKMAEQTGRMIAERGAILYCGGLGGVMEAAAKGAFEAGGVTVGILPGSKAMDANPYIKIPIMTDMGYARNVILVRSCDVLIAIAGSYGTLAEISLALKMWKPVIGLNTWENLKGVYYVSSPEEAVDKAFDMLP